MPTERYDIDFHADTAASSKDSALQYVAIDLKESGVPPEKQEEFLEPIDQELRDARREALVEGLHIAFQKSSEDGAEAAIRRLIESIDWSVVDETYREDIQSLVEKRLREKQIQLARTYEDLVTDTKQRAVMDSEDTLFDWEAIV